MQVYFANVGFYTYRFNVNWLKDKKHWTLEGVKADKNLTPGSKEMKVLEGIHKRNRSFRVDGPSKLDQEFLQKCYGKLMRTVYGYR